MESLPNILVYFGSPASSGVFLLVKVLRFNMLSLHPGPGRRQASKEDMRPAESSLGVDADLFFGSIVISRKVAIAGGEHRLEEGSNQDVGEAEVGL
jgi:hypothetical protein